MTKQNQIRALRHPQIREVSHSTIILATDVSSAVYRNPLAPPKNQGSKKKQQQRRAKVSIKNYGWDRCDFKKLEDERNAKKKPKKERPINLILLEEFLKD